MIERKIILLTGVAGFIGSNLADALITQGWKVIGIDNLLTGYIKNIKHLIGNKNFIFINEDIRNYEKIDELVKIYNIDYISHQAARSSVPKSVENPLLTNEININGTLNILNIAKENNIKKVVVAISSSVYGDTPELPKIESMPYNALSPYALTKVTKEIYCKLFWDLYNLPTIGLRYFNVYGKRQDPGGDYAAVIPRWIFKGLKDENLPLNGEGKQTRDFTYIDDVIQANIKALETKNKKALGKGYNICYGQQISIKELGEKIIKSIKSNSIITKAPARKGDINDSYGDYSLANKMFGYKPHFNMNEGFDHTIEWYRKNQNYFN